MRTGWKMAGSAMLGAAVTAVLFLVVPNRPERAPEPPAGPAVRPARPEAAPSSSSLRIPSPPDDVQPISGRGVIRGRVETAAGEGVPGVLIVATPRVRSPSRSEEPPPEPDLDAEVRRAVERTYLRVTGTTRTSTGEDGRYALTGLGDAEYSLRPYAESYTVRPARGHDAYRAKPGATVDFDASAVVRVRVRVEGIDETVGDRVVVVAAEDEARLERGGGRGWSPTASQYPLAPGTWFLQAVQGRNRERLSKPVRVELAAGEPERTVTLVLLDRPGIRGSIVVEGGLDLRNPQIHALRFEGDEPPSLDPGRRLPGAVRGRFDEESGRYSVTDIDPGRYLVWVTGRSVRSLGSAVVDVVDRPVEQELRVGLEGAGPYAVVRVFGPDGAPLDPREVSFSTSFLGPGSVATGGVEAFHREDGSWLVGHDPRGASMFEDEPEGTHRIQVRHRDLGTLTRVWEPESDEAIEFRFAAPATLVVRVPGLEQRGFGGRVGLDLRTHLPPTGMTMSGTPAQAAGDTFLVEKVQPGEWLLVLVAHSDTGYVMVDSKAVRVTGGENRIEWALSELSEVRVESAERDAALGLSLRRLDRGEGYVHQYARAEAGEEVVFRFVPPGRYEIGGTWAGERRTRIIHVPAETRVRLE